MSMTSLDFLNNIINPARVGAGESKHENTKFLLKVVDELDLDETGKKFQLGKTGHKMPYYDLTEDQMRLVGMRESKAVRRAVLAELNRLYAKAKEEPMFIAKDVAEALGYKDTDYAIRTHCKRSVILKPGDLPGMNCPNRGMSCIPESDVYRLVMRSKLESAEQFQDWVMEVPNLRHSQPHPARAPAR